MKNILKILIILTIIFLSGCERHEYFYITDVNIVDVESGRIIENRFVEIENGIITRIGHIDELEESMEQGVDGGGSFLTPGLSDMHVYISKDIAEPEYWKIHPGDRMLAAGITTIRDAGFIGYPGALAAYEEFFRGRATIGPGIIKSSKANYSSGNEPKDLKSQMAVEESDYIKILNYIPENQLDNILKWAEEDDIYTCGHIFTLEDLQRVCEEGFDELAQLTLIIMYLIEPAYADTIDWVFHEDSIEKMESWFSQYYDLTDEELFKEMKHRLSDVIDILKKNEIAVTTTLALDEVSAMKVLNPEEYREYAEKNDLPEFVDSIEFLMEILLSSRFRVESAPDFIIFQYRLDRIILRLLRENGIILLAGSSFTARSWYGLAPGIALHDELRILKECGFSNLEALRTATLNPALIAERMGVKTNWGVIKTGYRADFIFTDGNPLENLEILRKPESVMKSGIMYTSEELQALRSMKNKK